MALDSAHPDHDSSLLARARDKLRERPQGDRHWSALGAAALFALCAIVFAVAAVLAPPLSHDPAVRIGVK